MTVALILGGCLGLLVVLTVGAARGLFLAGSVGLAALGSSFAYIAKAMNEATRNAISGVKPASTRPSSPLTPASTRP